MIESFELMDLKHFTPNSISAPDDIMFVFNDEKYYKYSLKVADKVKAIILFYDNGERDWAGFFLLSDDFSARDGVIIKKFIEDKVSEYNPKRLWTASKKNHPVIERWHRFLGMSREEPREIQGEMHDIWSMVWE